MKTGLLFSVLIAFSLAAQSQQKRIALVIGAQSYSSLPKLRHALNDAQDMAASLKSKGFVVDAVYDPKTKKEIKDAITRYYTALRDAPNSIGIIFYAGHGMQYEGDNYIIPTTSALENPGDLEEQCVKMNTVMVVLKSLSKSLNILLLDACRTLPTFTRDSEQGLTRMDAPVGSMLFFATQAGMVASDGTGRNGLFTSKLLKYMNQPGLNITDVFKHVKQDVYSDSQGKQIPSFEDNSIGGDFYFVKSGGASATVAKTGPAKSQTTKMEKPKSEAPKSESPESESPATRTVTKTRPSWLTLPESESNELTQADQSPEFDGSLAEFMNTNLEYPVQARRMGVEGKVFVSFTVGKDGKISDVELLKGIGMGCDDAATKLVSSMPAWRPGLKDGKRVRSRVTLPINFRLN